MSSTPFPADMTERAIRIAQRKKLLRDCKDEIVRDTRELMHLRDRNEQIAAYFSQHPIAVSANVANEFASNVVAINTKIDGLKLLLAELDRLEASNA